MRLIIFDLDGVLFESRSMHFDTLNEALVRAGHSPLSYDEHLTRYNGLPTRAKLSMLGIEGQDAEEVQREKQALTLGWVHRNVRRDEKFVTLFTDLRVRGWKIAVASNAVAVTVMRALQLLGLWGLCDFVTAGDRGQKPKPSPEMYLRCMEVCEAVPATTLIVEDSPVGRAGAAATGASLIAVTCPAEVDEAVRRAVEVA